MTGLRVLTYNVGGFRGADGRVDTDRVATVIAEAAPALVALQQCGSDRHLLERLAARLGMHPYAAGGDNAFLADLPLRAVHAYDLVAGSCLRADAEIGGRRLHLFNARLGGSWRERDRQLQRLLGPDLLGHRDLAGACLLLGHLPGPLWRLRLAGSLRSVSRPWWSAFSPGYRPWFVPARAYLGGGMWASAGEILMTPTALRASPQLPLLFTVHLVDTRTYLRVPPEKHFGRRGQMEIAPG